MVAERKHENVTVIADTVSGSVTFVGKDGRQAGVRYMQSPGVTEDDVASMYSEDEALEHINDAHAGTPHVDEELRKLVGDGHE